MLRHDGAGALAGHARGLHERYKSFIVWLTAIYRRFNGGEK